MVYVIRMVFVEVDMFANNTVVSYHASQSFTLWRVAN